MTILDGLHHELATRIGRVLEAMKQHGAPMKVTHGFRTVEQQRALFAKGRTVKGDGVTAKRPMGRIVTHCDGVIKESDHQSGRAADCAFIGLDPYAESHPWALYGAEAKKAGLVWGGDFKNLNDRPHVELPKETV